MIDVLFKLDYKKDRRKIAIISIAIFLVAILLGFLPYIIKGKTLIWCSDGIYQHNLFSNYIVKNGGLKNLGKYDLKLGFGDDFLFSFAYYMLLDPFNILFYILPFLHPAIVFSLITAAKLFAMYIVMFLYLKHKGVKPIVAFAGAICYMLGGPCLYWVARHPQFATGLIFFPLICWGMEKVLAKERPYLLIFSVFLCCTCNYYQFYICAFCAVFYFVFYYISVREKFVFKAFVWDTFKVFCFALIGVLLSAFVLLPVGMGMMSSSRGATKGFDFLSGFAIKDFALMILNAIYPTVGSYSTSIGLNVVILLCLCMFVCSKKKKSVFIFFTAMLFVPFFGFAANVFNYYSGRWCFVYLFVAIVCASITLSNLGSEGDDVKDKALKIFFGCIILIVFSLLAFLFGYILVGKNAVLAVACSTLTMIVGVVCIVLFEKKVKIPRKMFKIFNFKGLVVAMMVLPIAIAFSFNMVYAGQFSSVKENNLQTNYEQYVAAQNLNKFYRTDVEENLGKTNRNLANGYMSTFVYNSSSNGAIFEFLRANGLNKRGTLGSAGLNGNVALQALLNVNYYISSTGMPYGFKKVEGYDNLYYNKNCLNFGSFYSNTVSKKFADELPTVERANLMLEALVLENDGEEFCYTNANEKLNFVAVETGVEICQNKICSDRNGSIKLTIEGCAGKEVHLNLNNFGFDYSSSSTAKKLIVKEENRQFKVKTANNELIYSFPPKGTQMYAGDKKDFSINLGYHQTDSLEVEIVLLQAGDWLCDEISVTGYNLQRFEQNVENLRKNSNFVLEDFENFDGKTLRGKIENETDGYLFLSLPYSRGWEAKVDGKKAEIVKANYGFMALKLDGGTHDIELNYSTPGLKIGTIISVFGLCCVAALAVADIIIVFEKKSKSKKIK